MLTDRDYAILRLIRQRGPRCEVKDFIDDIPYRPWPITRYIYKRLLGGEPGTSFGAVYASLDRLEDAGLVTMELGEPRASRGGRRPGLWTAVNGGRRIAPPVWTTKLQDLGRV